MRRTLQAAVLLTVACTVTCSHKLTAIANSNHADVDKYADQTPCGQKLELVPCGTTCAHHASNAIKQPCYAHSDQGASRTYQLDDSDPATIQRTGSQQQNSSSSHLTPAQDAAAAAPTTQYASIGGVHDHTIQERASNAADTQTVEATLMSLRPDLDPMGPLDELEPRYHYGSCTRMQEASVPFFPDDNTSIQIKQQLVPQRLSKPLVRRVKQYAINYLHASNFNGYGPLAQNITATESAAVRQTYYELRAVNPNSSFIHPGGVAGPAELALLKERLTDDAALQELALESLLTGSGVPPKVMRQWTEGQLQTWTVPTDTPLNYSGPFAMHEVDTKYNGISADSSDCPDNYPAGAPLIKCGHVSLVELDAQQAYKQALAFWATGNSEYAKTTLRIVQAWATNNQKFGLAWENGPLEAGWSVASFARALELLRGQEGNWNEIYMLFKNWVDKILMPLMDTYVSSSQLLVKESTANVFGNWHSTIAEAWLAYGILTDDRVRYNRAISLYHDTVKDYLKWGRGRFQQWSGVTRVIGEATETLRDVYHTQFGLGGLLQTAEMAWQQDEDLYSSYGYALAAALEMQAKIILAHNETTNTDDESQLPPGFKLTQSMPVPPASCSWKFDYQRQIWTAVNGTGAWVSDLQDGVKYITGNGYLPTGWELGYNHYVGRLGMQLPQTTALLQRHNVDWYTLHFGLGTLSHANTAALLWRAGLKRENVCSRKSKQAD